MNHDFLRRFLFEKFPVRGALLNIQKSWQDVLSVSGYSELLSPMLGKTLAAAGLLTSNLKFEGSLSLQIQSAGSIRLLVGECTDQGDLRGVVRMNELPDTGSELPLLSDAVLSINLQQADNGQRYQGIVSFAEGSLSKAVEAYFQQSEQLETRLWLAVDKNAAAGMLLQKMPDKDPDSDAWNRISILADTLTDHELLNLQSERLLRRLFHEEDVRLFKPRALQFNCSCTRERVAGMLKALGEVEVRDTLSERQPIEVRCEYCDRAYEFDAVDVAQLFARPEPSPPGPQAIQ
jgi:molecular chaperone Hsp33